MKRVAVFGAGLTGLAAAWKLRRLGAEVAVFDPAAEPGGVVRSLAHRGYLLELGPNTVLEKGGALTEWIDGLGLRGDVLNPGKDARKRFILHGGRPVAAPMSPLAFAASPLLSTRGKLRLLTEPFRAAGMAGDESVAAFFQRRLGSETVARLIDPFVSGIYAGDLVRLSARHCFPRLWEWERGAGSLVRGALAGRGRGSGAGRVRMVSFSGGLQTLARGAEAALEGRVFLGGAPAWRRGAGEGWEVEGHGRFDAVVAALPASALAGWLEGGGVAVPEIERAVVPAASVRVWHFGLERKAVAHPLDGFGVLAPSAEGEPILGVLFSSTLFPGRAPGGCVLLTVFQGGVRQPDWCRPDREDEARTAAWTAASRWLGIQGEPGMAHGTLWRAAIPQYEVGHQRVLDAVEAIENRHAGLFLRGSFRGGVAVGDCVASGFAAAGEVMGM
jgi:oxygen-dependent protoporphyrinogen oxidase